MICVPGQQSVPDQMHAQNNAVIAGRVNTALVDQMNDAGFEVEHTAVEGQFRASVCIDWNKRGSTTLTAASSSACSDAPIDADNDPVSRYLTNTGDETVRNLAS